MGFHLLMDDKNMCCPTVYLNNAVCTFDLGLKGRVKPRVKYKSAVLLKSKSFKHINVHIYGFCQVQKCPKTQFPL